jgi:OFA family oxalate/formate antiporter-like MFS transporter
MTADLGEGRAAVQDLTVNRGWQVTLAGLGINLALGILYTWSVISKAIPAEWGWEEADKSWPYSVACLVFALVMVPAGRLQDRIGPRVVAAIGGLLVGLGMILASFSTAPSGYILGFGLLAGAGIGFGYASATPPAVKWFPAARTGLIAGIVVSGFGLASVYAAPLAQWLSGSFGLPATMMALGIAFLIVVVGLAQLLVAPPKGYAAGGAKPAAGTAAAVKKVDLSPAEMLRTSQFYLLWFMYACGAGAGLMIISKLAMISQVQVGINLGFVFVAALAVGNGAGRIIAGMLSDKLGRQKTMLGCFVFQAVLVMLLSTATSGSPIANIGAMALISALIGANYGANLSLFPAITKDYYGLKNFGVNYGLIFTAWGMGGFMLSLVAGQLYDTYKTFAFAYYGASVLLILAAFTTFFVKPPRAVHDAAPHEAEIPGPVAERV